MRPYAQKSKSLVKARITTVKRLQITIDARVVGLNEGWFNETLLALIGGVALLSAGCLAMLIGSVARLEQSL
jgi:hypothetical protein